MFGVLNPRATPIVKADVPDTCIVTHDDQDVGLFCMGGGRTGETGQGCYQENACCVHLDSFLGLASDGLLVYQTRYKEQTEESREAHVGLRLM